MSLSSQIKSAIRDVPDFPKKGIIFKDISPLMLDVSLSAKITEALVADWQKAKIDAVVGVESRGFLWGLPFAQKLEVPFIPVRKKGKLPADTHSYSYELEYGSATIEVHKDAIRPGSNVLIHDDLLATGGSASAAAELVKLSGGVVAGFSFLIELSFLSGSNHLSQYSADIKSLVSY